MSATPHASRPPPASNHCHQLPCHPAALDSARQRKCLAISITDSDLDGTSRVDGIRYRGMRISELSSNYTKSLTPKFAGVGFTARAGKLQRGAVATFIEKSWEEPACWAERPGGALGSWRHGRPGAARRDDRDR